VKRSLVTGASLSAWLSMLLAGRGASAAVDTPATQDHPWSARAGTEIGQDDSRGSIASLDYAANNLFAGVSGLHTDAPENSGGTVSNGGTLYTRYGTATLRAGIAFDSVNDQDLRVSKRWTGTVEFNAAQWSADLSASTRATSFDSFDVSVTDAGRIGQRLNNSAQANCHLDDTGYGATLSYSGVQWSGYLSGNGSRYGDIQCGFDAAVPSTLNRLSGTDFQRLTGSFLDSAVARAGGQIGQDSRLLQYQYGAGLARHWQRFSIAMDYTDSKNEFGGATQQNFALTGSLPLTSALHVDLTAGTTLEDSDAAPYAGVYLAVRW
jgi:hypothetical protein